MVKRGARPKTLRGAARSRSQVANRNAAPLRPAAPFLELTCAGSACQEETARERVDGRRLVFLRRHLRNALIRKKLASSELRAGDTGRRKTDAPLAVPISPAAPSCKSRRSLPYSLLPIPYRGAWVPACSRSLAFARDRRRDDGVGGLVVGSHGRHSGGGRNPGHGESSLPRGNGGAVRQKSSARPLSVS